MRRPTAKRQQPGVALFPFLAVLICTMGSLIVLLVLVVQGAQASAAADRAAAKAHASLSAEELAKLKQEAEDLQWRADMLDKQKAEFAAKLQSKRLELSHLEDHIRRLEDEAKQLNAQSEAIQQAGKNKLLDQEFAEQRLAELQKQIADKKREVEAAKKKNANRKPAYAIIPYEGPNGTSRRPIYIECREDGIVIQPEGVAFSATDFQGPLGPGNPLDAALRAIREHQASQGIVGEPYPLIIVRPNGAIAFGACRAAMKHWENEFGYELVEQEAELKYPPADPRLADTLQRAIRDARLRQTALASAMPNRFGSPGKLASFRAADQPMDPSATGDSGSPGTGGSGGIGTRGSAGRGVGNGMGGPNAGVGQGSSGGPGGGQSGPPANSLAGQGFAGSGTSGGGMSGGGIAGSGPYGTGGSGGAMGNGPNASSQNGMNGPGGPPSGGSANSGSPGMGGQQGTGANGGSGNSVGGSANNLRSGNGSGAAGSYANNAGGASGGSGNSANGSQQNSGGAGGSQSSGGTAGGGAAGGSAGSMSVGSMGGMSSQSSGGSSGSAGGQAAQAAQDSANQQQSMSPNLNVSKMSGTQAKAKKAAKNRGENWGLPDSTSRATAITRPIRVECYADKLVLLPERNEGRVPLVVPVEEGIGSQVEVVLGTVWKHMDRWGLAMLNGYWKPVLAVEVKPGAEERFAELQAVLRGSGIEVERKK